MKAFLLEENMAPYENECRTPIQSVVLAESLEDALQKLGFDKTANLYNLDISKEIRVKYKLPRKMKVDSFTIHQLPTIQ